MRWKNRKDFLKKEEKIRYERKNKTAIVCIFFKSTENIHILSEYISKEENSEEFDFVIIDNSQGIEMNFAKELKNNNIIVVTTTANL
jgi:septum formation inhibitor-activating ATPase MinD